MEQQIEDYGMVNWNGIQIFTIIEDMIACLPAQRQPNMNIFCHY